MFLSAFRAVLQVDSASSENTYLSNLIKILATSWE
jgi:hypothetical protein